MYDHRVELDDRGGAVFAERLAEVEAVEPAPLQVVGEPVRVRADLDLSEQLLVGAAEDADPGGAAVAREEQLLRLVDENAGDAGQLGRQRAQVATSVAVEHLDPVGAGVGDVDAPTLPVDVRVVETRLRT